MNTKRFVMIFSVLAVFFVCLCGGGGGAFYIFSRTPTPTEPVFDGTTLPAPTTEPTATIEVPTATSSLDCALPTGCEIFNMSWYRDSSSDPSLLNITMDDNRVKFSKETGADVGLNLKDLLSIDEPVFVQADITLGGNIQASGGESVFITLWGGDFWLNCGIYGMYVSSSGTPNCMTSDDKYFDAEMVQHNTKHTIRFEINPKTSTISFFVDDKQFGTYTNANPNLFQENDFYTGLRIWSEGNGLVTGYVANMKIGQVQP